MTCHQCRDNLMDYVYGELPEASRREVQDHLAACEACRAELAQLQLGRSAVGRLGDDEGDASPGGASGCWRNPQAGCGGGWSRPGRRRP